jgi:hypothetical protein
LSSAIHIHVQVLSPDIFHVILRSKWVILRSGSFTRAAGLHTPRNSKKIKYLNRMFYYEIYVFFKIIWMKPFPIQLIAMDSTCWKGLLGCAPSSPSALTSAPLVWVVARLTELGPWLGWSQCNLSSAYMAFQGGLHVSVYLSKHFIHWHFDNHFYLVVFKAMFVKILILVFATVR